MHCRLPPEPTAPFLPPSPPIPALHAGNILPVHAQLGNKGFFCCNEGDFIPTEGAAFLFSFSFPFRRSAKLQRYSQSSLSPWGFALAIALERAIGFLFPPPPPIPSPRGARPPIIGWSRSQKPREVEVFPKLFPTKPIFSSFFLLLPPPPLPIVFVWPNPKRQCPFFHALESSWSFVAAFGFFLLFPSPY